MSTAAVSITDRVRNAFGANRNAALKSWRAAIVAAVTTDTEPDTADLERIASSLGIPADDVADAFAGDCSAYDRHARLQAGHDAAVREYAAHVKKFGDPEALRAKAERLRHEANALDIAAAAGEGVRTAGAVEAGQAKTLRLKNPRVWDSTP